MSDFEKIVTEISERMGEAVHNAWMEKRKKDKGWHNPNDCRAKTPDDVLRMAGIDPKYPPPKWCDRCHPCMVPYKDLPDSEKELDREYPKLFFKILGDMGYQVIEVGKKKGYPEKENFNVEIKATYKIRCIKGTIVLDGAMFPDKHNGHIFTVDNYYPPCCSSDMTGDAEGHCSCGEKNLMVSTQFLERL